MPEAENHEDAKPAAPKGVDSPREPFADDARRFDTRGDQIAGAEAEAADRRRKVATDPALGPASILGAGALSRGGGA